MALRRHSEDTVISKEDFDKTECQAIIDRLSECDYFTLYDAFSKKAQSAIDEKNYKKGKIYWLFADACSLALNSESRNKPFNPMLLSPDGRSAIAEDFNEDDINFFIEILPDINDHRLKARLADLVWLRGKDRNIKFALQTIDSYRQIKIKSESWYKDVSSCWHRALDLAIMLGKGSGDRLKYMGQDFMEAFNSATADEKYFALKLADTMARFGLGQDNTDKIAQKLENFAEKAMDEGDYFKAKDYFNASSKWYHQNEDKEKSYKMTFRHAESYVKEAEARMASSQPSNMVAADFYEKAIQILRTIPGVGGYRTTLKVDERIAELQKLMNDAGKKSIEEMAQISSGEIDIAPMMEMARKAVSGKKPIESLKEYANLHDISNIEHMQKEAIEIIKKHPFSSFFGGTHYSSDGRVIAKTKGIDFDQELTPDHPSVNSVIMRNHGLHISLAVQAFIMPALDVLHLEHRLQENDFFEIVKNSPIIPPGREYLFTKGLFAGYDRDFITAIHILIPQLEHLVRFRLKSAGVKTTTLDSLGIENETGLSKLVALPEMKTIFGEDLTFEIKALFCDPLGANLRNEIAHGLVDHNACYSVHGVYAWWLVFKIVFNTCWNATQGEGDFTKDTK